MKLAIALLAICSTASAKLGGGSVDRRRDLLDGTSKVTCGACSSSGEITCTAVDSSTGAVQESFACACPADCPAQETTFTCDVAAALGNLFSGSYGFAMDLDDGTGAQCRYDSTAVDAATTTAECYRYCPPPPERRMMCAPCENNEIACDLYEYNVDGTRTLINALSCNCPDGDCSTDFYCIALDGGDVEPGSFAFVVGDTISAAGSVHTYGTCEVTRLTSYSSVTCTEKTCLTAAPTPEPTDAPTSRPTAASTSKPTAAPERRMMCGACENNEIACELYEYSYPSDGTHKLINTLTCNCPDGDCTTDVTCVAADGAVLPGDFLFVAGGTATNVGAFHTNGTCAVDPNDASSTTVVCAEACRTAAPTSEPTDAPTASPTAASTSRPTECVQTCGGPADGTCCDGLVCAPNRKGTRFSCKRP